MAGKRKSWKQLTPTYRERLERKGITKASHEAGASIASARGQGSEAQERERNRRRRNKAKYIHNMVEHYGVDEDELREAINDLSTTQFDEVMALQQELERLYLSGRTEEASALWHTRDTSVPHWMNFYHAYFG